MLYLLLLLSVLVVAALAHLFAWRRRCMPGARPLDWLDRFSAASYQPMRRLLDKRDYWFLALQRGYKPSIARRLRRQRIGIFQAYLGGMIWDFQYMLNTARYI